MRHARLLSVSEQLEAVIALKKKAIFCSADDEITNGEEGWWGFIPQECGCPDNWKSFLSGH